MDKKLLEKSKTAKWEELTEDEKKQWENLSKNMNPIQKLWISLSQKKECIYCKKEFLKGITNKHPGESKFPLDSYFWFTSVYLVHLQTTHGYTPEIVDMFLKKIYDRK